MSAMMGTMRRRHRGRHVHWPATFLRKAAAMALWGVMSAGITAPVLAQLAPEPGPGELQLAWLSRDGEVRTTVLDAHGRVIAHPSRPIAPNQTVPLGSLWKLVAYARLAEDAVSEPDYVCRGHHKDEVYCCTAGQRIDRGTALWRSCGLYFEPARVNWSTRPLGASLDALPDTLKPLADASQLSPRSTVPLADWLRWLNHWPVATQQAARDDLLPYWLEGPGRDRLSVVGTRLRLKTFTLERRDTGALNERWAGASGWLSDGRPVWLAARGSSKHVLPQWAPAVLAHIDQAEARPRLPQHPQAPCIDVDYLSRYPIAQVLDAQGHVMPASDSAQPLGRARYRLVLANGNRLDVTSDEDLTWIGGALRGRLTLDEYVARVVDREGKADVPAAARALAIAARTYVLSHGQTQGGCLRIEDSSQRQRVAPRPATLTARLASEDTADLVLSGSEGRYHGNASKAGVMAWSAAVEHAKAGLGFDAILRNAYAGSGLVALTGRQGRQCEPLSDAQAWLDRQLPRWRRQLQGQAGYTAPSHTQVCRLELGLPHAQQASRRIYVRGVQSMDERLTLAHEYLHLAFSGHPRGSQEAFVEGWARTLLGVD